MTHSKFRLSCGLVVAGLLAVIVGRACSASDSRCSAQGCDVHSTPDSRHSSQFDTSQAFPPVAAADTDDTDDEELSDRGRPHAMVVVSPPVSVSRRAIRMASSVRQTRQNTLNALCVRLQI
jgi:hypothetical protein